MISLHKKFLVPALTVIMLGGTLVATSVPANAAWNLGFLARNNFVSRFIDFFSQRFNLDRTKVQGAVDDFAGQIRASITPRPTLSPQQVSDRDKTILDSLVKNGKITSGQETSIINEITSLRAKYPLTPALTFTQRLQAAQSFQNDFKTWAQANNIPIQSFPFSGLGLGFPGRGGMMRRDDGDRDNDAREFRMFRFGTSATPTLTPSPSG